MIDGFEKVTEIHPAYLNDFVIRASHRFVATALWGADESIRSAVLRHLPPLTREYILYEIEAYEGRPDDGVEETQLKMLELLCDKANSEFYQESMISPAHFQPTIHLAGNSYEDVVNYVLGLAGKIHAQGMASIVPDISNCPIEFLRLGLELLLLNLPWEEINSILWGHIRTFRLRNGQYETSGRWRPATDEAEAHDRTLNFCLVSCSSLQLQAHPVYVSRSLSSFKGGDYERLRKKYAAPSSGTL